MTKNEFEKLIDKEVDPSDYEIIQVVYQYYDEKLTKEDIKMLYSSFGMKIISDMYERARQIAEISEAILAEQERHKAEMDRLTTSLKNLRWEEE